MRLWHKDLIPYLPKQQLIGQWRELNSIYKLRNKHILINFVYNNDMSELFAYSNLVLGEMDHRGYKHNESNYNEYFLKFYNSIRLLSSNQIYPDKMNDRYLKQCLFNLQEKYDCGGISKEEWIKIVEKFGDYLK